MLHRMEIRTKAGNVAGNRRTGYGNKVVLGGAQRRVEIDRVSRRINCQEEIKDVAFCNRNFLI